MLQRHGQSSLPAVNKNCALSFPWRSINHVLSVVVRRTEYSGARNSPASPGGARVKHQDWCGSVAGVPLMDNPGLLICQSPPRSASAAMADSSRRGASRLRVWRAGSQYSCASLPQAWTVERGRKCQLGSPWDAAEPCLYPVRQGSGRSMVRK